MKTKGMDYPLLAVTMILVSFGLLMVFSSSYYYAMEMNVDKLHFFLADLRWIALGTVMMLIASVVPYRVYRKVAVPLFLIGLVLLVYVLFGGTIVNNAQRWIYIGGQGFLPAEMAKFTSILFFAYSLEKTHEKLNDPVILGIYLLFIAGQAALIMLQPNMSTAMTLAGILMLMLFVAGLKWLYVLIMGAAAGGAGYLLIRHESYRLERFIAFTDPIKYQTDESWQVLQSLYALGTGGVFGVGIGMSTQNKLYIPEPHNDFILATVGEEMGLIGTAGLLILFLILIYRCVKITMNAPDYFSFMLGTGVTGMIALQVVMNFAVATSSMPATGVTLPLISYGGTSLLIMMTSIGIMLNISKHSNHTDSR